MMISSGIKTAYTSSIMPSSQNNTIMKKLLSLLVILVIGSAAATDTSARGYHRYYRPRVYIAPMAYCAPMAYYRPACAQPVYRDVFAQPHWIHTPYGRQWVQGQWIRQRVYWSRQKIRRSHRPTRWFFYCQKLLAFRIVLERDRKRLL